MIASLLNVTKTYSSGEKVISALDAVSLDVDAGENVLIIGPSGSGKSTLLYVLGLLLDIEAGSRTLFHRDAESLEPKERASIRLNSVGFIFQDFELLPRFTVEENIALAFFAAGGDAGNYSSQIDPLLDRFELTHRRHHFSNELSIGEKQRAAICRALINDPELILADEPTAHLDSQQGSRIVDRLLELSARYGKTLVVVSHDERIRRKFNRIHSMSDGALS